MGRSLHKVFAGVGCQYTVQLYDDATPPAKLVDAFAGTEALTCQAWPGDSQAVSFTPAAAWLSGPAGTITVAYAATDTAAVAPGYYEGWVRLADSTAALASFDVEVLGSPGTSAPSLAGMATVRAALSELTLSDAQVEFLPTAVDIASDVVRRHCARWFTRRTLTAEYEPSYDGRVRLPEFPVNQVLRVAIDRQVALTVTCDKSANQMARAYFATRGDRATGLTYTGLVLTRSSYGVTTTTPTLPFSSYATVTALAAAVNAVGGGWAARVGDGMGGWPVTELCNGDAAQGCLDDGATFEVYATDEGEYGLDGDIGFVYLPRWRNVWSSEAVRWGPGGDFLFDTVRRPRRVLVACDLGFDTIPRPIQEATAALAKMAILTLAMDWTVQAESADRYSYSVNRLAGMMTPDILQLLALYRVSNA